MVEAVAGQALADALAGITAEMAGQSLADAYDPRMTDPFYDSSGVRIGKGNKTTEKPAVSGDTTDSMVDSTDADPIDAWQNYTQNVDENVSDVTGGIVDGSTVQTFDYSILEKSDTTLQAVAPVAVPTDIAAVALMQAVGVSVKWRDMGNALQNAFIANALLATGVYDKARNLVVAWWDGINILFPRKTLKSAEDFLSEEEIGEFGGEVDYSDVPKNIMYDPTYSPSLSVLPNVVKTTNTATGVVTTVSAPGAIGCITHNGSNFFFFGTQPFTVTRDVYPYTYNAVPVTRNGITYYHVDGSSNQANPDYPISIYNRDYNHIWDTIYLIMNGTGWQGHFPEGTEASQAVKYTSSSIPSAGGIATSPSTTEDVVAISIDNGIDSTGATADPNGPSDETAVQSLPQEPTLPIPSTVPSDPTISLSDSSVVDSSKVATKAAELAESIRANPPASSGIIGFPDLPNIGGSFPSIIPSSGPGLIHVYNPTPSEFISFGRWLWVTYADATIDKIWNNPFDGIVGAFELYATPQTSGTDHIYSGFLTCPTTSKIVQQRYTEIDCGTVIVPEFYGNYFDYSPYSQCYLYLPFIGINEVSIDDIVGHAVNIRYRIDAYNGSCIAMIYVAKDGYRNLCYQFAGNCAVEVPLAGGSQAAIKAGVLQAEAYARGAQISGVVGGIASTMTGAATGGLPGALMGLVGGITSGVSAYTGVKAGLEAARVANKSSVQHSGQFGASHGAMGAKKPFIIIRNPIQVKVVNYNEEYGFPAHKRVVIGACRGYLQVREVNVISAHATNAEKVAIENALKAGVYVE